MLHVIKRLDCKVHFFMKTSPDQSLGGDLGEKSKLTDFSLFWAEKDI